MTVPAEAGARGTTKEMDDIRTSYGSAKVADFELIDPATAPDGVKGVLVAIRSGGNGLREDFKAFVWAREGAHYWVATWHEVDLLAPKPTGLGKATPRPTMIAFLRSDGASAGTCSIPAASPSLVAANCDDNVAAS
jgi:hypothetical protein